MALCLGFSNCVILSHSLSLTVYDNSVNSAMPPPPPASTAISIRKIRNSQNEITKLPEITTLLDVFHLWKREWQPRASRVPTYVCSITATLKEDKKRTSTARQNQSPAKTSNRLFPFCWGNLLFCRFCSLPVPPFFHSLLGTARHCPPRISSASTLWSMTALTSVVLPSQNQVHFSSLPTTTALAQHSEDKRFKFLQKKTSCKFIRQSTQ